MGIVAKLGIKTSILLPLIAALIGCGGGPAGSGGGGVVSDGGGGQVKIGDRGGQAFSEGAATSELLRVDASSATWEVGVVVVDGNNFAVNDNFDVTFSSTCVTSGLAQIDGETESKTVTTQAGRASIQYNSGQCDGVDSVVATLTSGLSVLRASVDLDIDSAIRSNEDGGDGPLTILMGNGTSSSFVEGALLASSTSLQAGASALISVNLVDTNGAPYTTRTPITFSSGCVSQGLASFTESVPLDTQGGLASITYVANGCSGDDVIEARATVNGSALRAEVTVNVATDTVLGVEFVSLEQPRLAITGIGGIETTDVFFRVVGAQGAPIVGESVSFELTNAAGGATLAEGSESGVTDSSGQVRTVVQSGTVNSSTQVIATHDATTLQGFSQAITISTGVPTSRSFDLSFLPHNPRAAGVNGAEVQVTANATDQFGNAPPDGTRVSFRSVEVGLIDSECELVDGECTVTWSSSGSRTAITPDTLGRGFRATVVGFMSGAEDFRDFNANGLFDIGNESEEASVVHLGEVYTDENENNQYDIGEDFVDSFLNNPAPSVDNDGGTNGLYDGADDAVYLIYNGPCSQAVNSNCPVTRLQSVAVSDQIVISLSSEFPAFCSRGTLPDNGVEISGSYPISISGMVFCDINANSLPADTTIDFSVSGSGLSIVGPASFEVSNITTEPTAPLGVVIGSTEPLAAGVFTITIRVPEVADQVLGSWAVQGTL